MDGMSIKELVQYEQKVGRCFGYVDCGGFCEVGDGNVHANEVLVIMVVGLRSYWKLPVALKHATQLPHKNHSRLRTDPIK